MNDDREKKVYTLIAEHLGVTFDQISPLASLEKDLGADSLDAADLVIALNSAFRISIKPEHMASIETVADLMMLVQKHMARR